VLKLTSLPAVAYCPVCRYNLTTPSAIHIHNLLVSLYGERSYKWT
jgi:hypothetical protein